MKHIFAIVASVLPCFTFGQTITRPILSPENPGELLGVPYFEWPNYEEYKICDRAPGISELKFATADGTDWIDRNWISRPSFELKKSVTAHDAEVIVMQSIYLEGFDEVKQRLSFVVSEYIKRNIDLKPCVEICMFQSKIMKSRAWKALREREPRKQHKAIFEIKNALQSIRQMTDSAFIKATLDVKREFALWAEAHPAAAQTIVNNRRIKTAEKRAAMAEARASEAEIRAQNAESAAQAAASAAAAAEAEAAEANRRASDAQFRLNSAGVW